MAAPPAQPRSGHDLARQVRQRFGQAFDELARELDQAVARQLDGAGHGGVRMTFAEMSATIEAADAFRRARGTWLQATGRNWARARSGQAPAAARQTDSDFALVGDDVVEGRITAARLGAAAADYAGTAWGELRLRLQRLEGAEDLPPRDPLRPEVFAQALVDAWSESGLTRPMWLLVQGAIQATLGQHFKNACEQANTLLAQRGVSTEVDLRDRVRRTPGPAGAAAPPASGQAPAATPSQAGTLGDGWTTGSGMSGGPAWGHDSNAAPAHAGGQASPLGAAPRGAVQWLAGGPARYALPGDTRWQGGGPAAGGLPARFGGYAPAGAATGSGFAAWQAGVAPSALARAEQETRMATGLSPMARARQRAQGVLGQLRRLFTDQVGGHDPGAAASPISPSLASALAGPDPAFATTQPLGRLTATGAQATGAVTTPGQVQVVAAQLRQRATELKAKTEKPAEKATIEIVALMFQAILAEERIAPGIRIWFARLQIPVLRLALAEPDFFASVEHPARQLIDRMGACAMGFDAQRVGDERLEREIKRIVQVIEQYPETGRRVYQLMLDEFRKFLGNALTGPGAVQQAATLAQQVEQKEALAVQYTIELRRMLAALPVGEDVREFLFRIWSDVLAIATVRHGAQHKQALRFKQAAADLLWVVSAKRDRNERSRVVQQLPDLLLCLRDGMAMLALPAEEQDRHIQMVKDATTRAFTMRDEGLGQTKLQELSRSLAALENAVTDDPEGDMYLDPAMIELMFGEEGAVIEVIATGGSEPGKAILQWARSLELGAWFTLDHQGLQTRVQYAWRSARGQLHLLSAGAGKSFLVQSRRLAAYLQAGLLVPVEDEALTVRATRDALAKLQVKPDALLQ